MTINLRLVLGFGLASLLPLCLLAALAINTAVVFFTDTAQRSLRSRVELIAPEFDHFVKEIADKNKVLSQANVLEGKDQNAMSRYLNEVAAELANGVEFFYFDTGGTKLASSGVLSSQAIQIQKLGVDPLIIEKTLSSRQGAAFVSDTIGSRPGELHFYVLSPVTDDDNIKVIGIIAAKIPMTALNGLMSRVRASLEKRQIAYLLADNGAVLIPPGTKSAPNSGNSASFGTEGLQDRRKLIDEFGGTGIAGSLELKRSDGSKEIVVFSKISDNGSEFNRPWYLVVHSPLDVIIAPAYQLAYRIALLGGAAILIAMCAGIWFARSLTIPLNKLIGSANELVEDGTDLTEVAVETVEKGPRELVVLSQALSKAIGQIASRTHDLDMARLAAETAQAEAERSSSARAAFLAIMSHEIRTPLNGILGMVQILQMDQTLTKEQAEYLSMAQEAGEGLLQILSDVLDLSKIESETFKPERIEFSLDDVISPVLSIYKQTTSDAVKIHYNCLVDEKLRFVGDPTRIRQIMWNLVGNAVKFTAEGSVNVEAKVKRNATSSRGMLCVTISDTGIGIDPADMKKILEPFNQADTSLTRTFEGVGLGLTIVQKLLSAMDGKLEMASIVGRGTVVSIDVPVEMVAPDRLDIPANAAAAAMMEIKGKSGQSAVVVDDNKINALVAAEMLRKSGLQTFVASSGREALDMLGRQKVDYIILDQHMPVMDGTATAAAIRAHADKNVSQVRIIGLTADARLTNKEAMKQAGMNIVLTKPVRHEALLLAIKNLSPVDSDENLGTA